MATMLYRSGAKHKIWGIPCEYRIFEPDEVAAALNDGWVKTPLDLKEKKEPIPEKGSEYESELRARIKALGGRAGGKSSIDTLEKQLAGLEAKHGNNND